MMIKRENVVHVKYGGLETLAILFNQHVNNIW